MPKIGGNQTGKRRGGDFYPTAPSHTLAIVPHLPAGSLWEPAAGDGAMVDVLRRTHHVIASDIEPARPDIVQADFLTVQPPSVAAVVTNPPFSLAKEFIERGLDIGVPTFLLLPVNYLGGTERFDTLYSKRPPAKLVVVSRRMHVEGVGASQFNHCWYCWEPRRIRTTKVFWARG